jgi:hypothetical protein
MKKEFFSLRASDKVSLWRSIPDTRDQLYVQKKRIIRTNKICFFVYLDVNQSSIQKIYQQHQL